jgi:mono/diheme cytochrome c family protein
MRLCGKLFLSMAAALALLSGSEGEQRAGTKADEKFFTDKIAPILQKRCLECHSGTKPRGGLDLTTRDKLLRGGNDGPVVVPGKPDKSLLLRMISPPQSKMPKRGDTLTGEQVADVRHWIADGAAWPRDLTLGPNPAGKLAGANWWSVQPLRRPPLPRVKNSDWVRTPIDAFLLTQMEALGLTPAPEVDRVTFIRRAKFDLHGLPPTPWEIEQFVNDTAPGAFERLVDRLLASPLYGERWGRFWLDIAHYADTHGFDKDKRRLWAWLFRDWVISAFNHDMPYRRFVRMQLAGDVLHPADSEGIIATGFVVAGPWDFVGQVELREGTVDKLKTRLLDRDDMVANAMSTFVSVTAHCARCHDHPFDPIGQKEYYQLQAVFAGVERGDRSFLTPATNARILALNKEKAQGLARKAELLRQVEQAAGPKLAELDTALQRLNEEMSRLPRTAVGKPSPSNGYHSGIEPKPDVAKWVQVDLGKPVAMDEIRLLPARPTDYPDTPGFGFPARFQVAVSNDPTFRSAVLVADHTHADYPNPGDHPLVIRPGGKTARYIRVTAQRLWLRQKDYVFALAELQVDSGGKNVALGAKVSALDSIEAGRWSTRYLVDNCNSRIVLPDLTSPAAAAFRRHQELQFQMQQLRQKRQQLADALIPQAVRQELAALGDRLTRLDKQLQDAYGANKVYAVLPIPPRPIHRLHRGDVEKPKEQVGPGALSLIPGLPAELTITNPQVEGNRRLALANWITDDRNVLTWRSIVNRVWQYHFGHGIVDSPNDFGKNGSRPTHPALLDWLAVEFRDGGQSFKKLHRLILLSSAYRQSCTHNEANAKKDGDNRFLWRMNRRKLDAEAVRDSVLAVSGQLRLDMGGPGYALFRFKDDHSPIYDHTDVKFINDPTTYRRTVYRFVVRSVPNPFLECMDCADPNISVPRRNETLTALQALALLNDPFMIQQSTYFARRLERHSSDPREQIDLAFRLAFGRRPTAEESAAVVAYTRRHGLVNSCRLLFNANEFLFVD